MDQHGEETPGITGTDGKNPLLDKRVRKAISMAINREAIVERIMNGVAVPAGELLPQGFFGTTPGAAAEKYDPEGAKKLLAEAGHPDGLGLPLGSPHDRYINAAPGSQAVRPHQTHLHLHTPVTYVTP